jgi:hypothetical protein
MMPRPFPKTIRVPVVVTERDRYSLGYLHSAEL